MMQHPVITRLRELLRAQPFQSFSIVMVNGRIFHVPHEDFLLIGLSGNVIYDDGDQIKNINATLVSEIHENAAPGV
ncbi:MAG: hypothetical protein K1X42_12255 [Opitutaceae bacterium]|nr:hypothetical protein [Opitutaceae bacterium]